MIERTTRLCRVKYKGGRYPVGNDNYLDDMPKREYMFQDVGVCWTVDVGCGLDHLANRRIRYAAETETKV